MRGRALIVAALAAALVPASPAAASKLVRFTTTSRYVDPANAKAPFNSTHRAGLPLPTSLPVDVLLPNGYDGKRTFPVLYLLHGHGDTYNSWLDPNNGDAARLTAGLRAIVVMPEAGRGWYTNWWLGGKRSEPAWEHYHLDELVPLIARRFKVRHGRRWHAIAGLSMGGEGAMYYATQRPGYFGSAASFSGPLNIQRPEWPTGFDTQGEKHMDVFGDPEAQRFYWTGHNPTALLGNLTYTRLFVAVGDGTPTHPGEVSNYVGVLGEADLRRHAEDFVTAARAAGIDVTYDPRRGIHAWPYWRQHLTDALAWGFFRPATTHPGPWSFSTVSQTSQAWGFRFHFVAPPAEVETFSLNGRRLAGSGSGTVRIRIPGGHKLTRMLPFSTTLASGHG